MNQGKRLQLTMTVLDRSTKGTIAGFDRPIRGTQGARRGAAP